ncbi:MAG: membrane dipeptidase [Candidatus Poribacteria bacterium]|nr:membrane dipeptidase [Candidatus Poribacteria bacterium]
MNETIQRARDVALSILKPSRREIEHGLELHKNSLVCESYGFSPRAAVDGDAVKAAVKAGASEVEIQDMTEDMRMTRYVTDPLEREEYMMAWEAAGVTCILQNAGEEGNSPLRLMKRLARFTYVTDMMRDFVCRAVTSDDIVAAKAQNKHCLYMTGNGVPLPQDWGSVEEELRYIRVFFQLGIRMMHLTYNRRNMIGDGCAEPNDAGLSDFGRAVVAEMNRVGVIVDVAHSGWKTSLDAAKASERPMVASHSGCVTLNAHYRCKPDEVIRAIVDTGGYIGICCIPRFLGGKGDITTMLDHIDYVVKHFGADHVTIGTDVAYTSSVSGIESQKIPKRGPSRSRWEALWHPNEFGPEWRREHQVQSMAWTNWPLFTVGMVQRGYSDDDIQKILGGNVLRVARAVR